ncbi:rhamnogalacturonan acetylesterase [Bacillus subtilis]
MKKWMAAVFVMMLMLCFGGIEGVEAAEQKVYQFDFGSGSVEPGYIGVRAFDRYDRSKGYGFQTPENMKDVSASGTGVKSDAVQFLAYGTKSNNTFNVDLPNGLYEVKVTLGNTARASVAAEGVFQVINMTGDGAEDTFQIPVTDGQLNLVVTEGKAGTAFTLSALKIKKLSDQPVTNRTIYVGGDSTVCNYYPLNSSKQAGWGQMLPHYIDKHTFQVRNMASGGQIARGFRNDGQLEAILKYIKPGDYFMLQLNPKHNESEAEFKEMMRDMIRQVKAKGADVILSTPQGRATDFTSEGVHSSVNRWYRASILALAEEEKTHLIDLNVLSSAYFTSIGPEKTLALYMDGDTLHPNRAGADALARLAVHVQELKRQGIDGF